MASLAQRLQLLRELLARRHRERRRDADVVQHAVIVVEAEQQRADGVLAALVPAEAGDHAVGGARVLDLEHRALARLVGALDSGLAITPSRPAPSKRCSQSCATSRSRVIGVRYTGGFALAEQLLQQRARRSLCGASTQVAPVRPPAGRRRRTRPASPSPASRRATPPDAAAAAARRSRGRAAWR